MLAFTMNQKTTPPSISFRVTIAVFALALVGGAVSHGAPPETVDVIIQFKNAPGANEENLVKKHGGKVTRKFKIVRAVSATVPAAASDKIKKEAGVLAVEPDGKIEAHDLANTWGVNRIGCGPVHAGTFGENVTPVAGAGVKVAIVDSGIDYTHPELLGNYAGGYDFVNNDADPFDDQGHGTHVSGTVAALRNGAGVVGAAPEVDLYGVKVLGADGSGSWSWIIAGLDWCVDHGVSVANFSLGSSSHPGTTVETAFKNAADAGLLLVASAGNAGEGADTVGYPAKFSTVVAVASTTGSDERSSFSSTGPAVELAAPGSGIYSTLRGGGYGYMSGTSMAAPHVSGVAALVIAAGVADSNGDGRIAEDVRMILQVTARDLGTVGADSYFGHGLVNAEFAALLAFDPSGGEPTGPIPVFDAPTSLSGTVSTNTVSLTWTDNSNVEEGFQIQYGIKSKSRTTWYSWGSAGADVAAYASSLSNGTYLFRVRAIKDNSAAYTSWSNQVQLTVGSTSGGGKPGKR